MKILSNKQFNKYCLKKGEKFDFTEFKSSKLFYESARPIQNIIKLAKKLIKVASQNSDEVILCSARQNMDDKNLFKKAMLKHGIDLDHVYFERAGLLNKSTPSENKKIVFEKYIASGNYSNFRLFDDCARNLGTFINFKKKYPLYKFSAFKVLKSGKLKKFN